MIIFLLLISITTIYYSLHYGITPMPSNRKALKTLFDHLPQKVEGEILELGAGFGAVAIPLARRFSNQVIAYEISPLPYLILKLLKLILRLKNLKVVRQDFFKISFNNAGLCVCYLFPKAMIKLEDKFEKELKQGTLIVSNTFALPHWAAEKTLSVKDLYTSKIFFYQKHS